MAPPWLSARWARLRAAWLPVLQCAVAAGLAWLVATSLVGHERPFFAPIAAIVCLGVSLGSRLRRTVELVVGVVLGILVADLIVGVIGTGAWQIALVVALAMATAVLVDGGAVITLQAGSSAVLVATLLPPGQPGGPERAVDALVGGVVAVGVLAALPADAMRSAQRDASNVLRTMEGVLRDVADGLTRGDTQVIEGALRAARGTQGTFDSLRTDLRSAREVAQVAPLRWRSRARVQRLADMVDPLDNAARNVRVLARRAGVAVADRELLDAGLAEHLVEVAGAVAVLRGFVEADPEATPTRADALDALRRVTRGLTAELGEPGGLSVHVVVAQVRSVAVDLLQAAGASRDDALAVLPPTVEHPAVPPDGHGLTGDHARLGPTGADAADTSHRREDG